MSNPSVLGETGKILRKAAPGWLAMAAFMATATVVLVGGSVAANAVVKKTTGRDIDDWVGY